MTITYGDVSYSENERDFVVSRFSVLCQLENQWRGTGAYDTSLCVALADCIRSLMQSIHDDVSPIESKVTDIDGLATQADLGSTLGGNQNFEFTRFVSGLITFEASHLMRQARRKVPLLSFDLREDFLLQRTVCAVVDLRPWLTQARNVGKFERVKGSVTNIFFKRAGPIWKRKFSKGIGLFSGFWTSPGELPLDMPALAKGDTDAVKCTRMVVKQFLELCSLLRDFA